MSTKLNANAFAAFNNTIYSSRMHIGFAVDAFPADPVGSLPWPCFRAYPNLARGRPLLASRMPDDRFIVFRVVFHPRPSSRNFGASLEIFREPPAGIALFCRHSPALAETGEEIVQAEAHGLGRRVSDHGRAPHRPLARGLEVGQGSLAGRVLPRVHHRVAQAGLKKKKLCNPK